MDKELTDRDLRDYLDALQQHRRPMIAIAAVLFAASLLVAFLLPPEYRSTATILIEEQEIPEELVRSTITSYALQRIQTISQRVMARNTLLELVNKYDLYADKRRSETTEEILKRMQEDIKLDTIRADVIDPRSGRPTQATIAFTISFSGESPAVVQKVANELVTLYLNENLKTRTEKVGEARLFLTEEANRLRRRMSELEAELVAFKERNRDSLPELMQFNLQQLNRAESEIRDTKSELRAAQERKFYLEGQLQQINPMYSGGTERLVDPEIRLRALQNEYISASTKYSPDHPDVVRLKREIEALQSETGDSMDSTDRAKALANARTELASARKKYSDDHPDVQRLSTLVSELEAGLQDRPERRAISERPQNPAYITLKAQLEAIDSAIVALNRKLVDLNAKYAEYEERIAKTPQAEREYGNLGRDLANASAKYQEIKAKQMQAEVAQQLEKESKAEKFTLIDPPQLPEKPVSPNRPAIVFLGFLLSIAGGVGYTAAAESMDDSVRGAKGLIKTVGAAPLAIIPLLENAQQQKRRSAVRAGGIVAVVAAVILLLLLTHLFIAPLDVLWFKQLRKLSMMTGG